MPWWSEPGMITSSYNTLVYLTSLFRSQIYVEDIIVVANSSDDGQGEGY